VVVGDAGAADVVAGSDSDDVDGASELLGDGDGELAVTVGELVVGGVDEKAGWPDDVQPVSPATHPVAVSRPSSRVRITVRTKAGGLLAVCYQRGLRDQSEAPTELLQARCEEAHGPSHV
jgi:hypothetical protein